MNKPVRDHKSNSGRKLVLPPDHAAEHDSVPALAFLSGFLLATLLAGLAMALFGRSGNAGSLYIWLLGLVLASLAIGVAGYIYQRMRTSLLGGPDALLTALDQVSQACVVTDEDGEPLYANAAYRLYTAAVEGMAPSPLSLNAVAQDDQGNIETVQSLWRKALTDGSAKAAVAVALPHGNAAVLMATVQKTRAPGDYLVWQFEDVPASSQSQPRAEAGYRLIGDGVAQAGLGMIVIDEADLVCHINKAMCDWLALDLQTVAQGIALQTLAPNMRLSANLPIFGGRAEFQRLDGSGKLKLEISTLPLYASTTENPLGHILLARQIVSTAGVEALAPSTNVRFEQFFNDAPVAIATADAEGNLKEFNRLFQSLIVDDGSSKGRSLSEILSSEDLRTVLERLSSALKGDQKAPPLDVHLRRDPGATGQLYIHSVADGDEDSSAILYLIDTTEQKNLEMQFAQSQKMQAVGQLAGGIAHDFNNLLTAISGFCDLLLVRHGPGDHSFEDIIQIKQNANRAANLVRQLLAFSRQQTLRPKVLVVTDVLAEISNLVRRLIGENIELRMIHGRDLGPVRADQGQLEQVIINLAVNARDAMTDGGTLTIRTANISLEESKKLGHEIMPPNDYVLIEVSDQGMGIPSENIGKIFEPFFSTKEVGKGTGLGLSTVYGIVKQTGGFIFPDSAPGEGATFRIYLPIHQVEEEEVAAKPVRTAAVDKAKDLTGKGSILLVEDEDAVRMFACRALRNKGYNVHEAASGEAALEIVDQGTEIDLLISDVVMPQMDGPSLVKEIRRRRENIKIIFISGYAEDAFRKNLGKGEVFSFLPKPFSLKQLAEKVKDVLEQDEVA